MTIRHKRMAHHADISVISFPKLVVFLAIFISLLGIDLKPIVLRYKTLDLIFYSAPKVGSNSSDLGGQ